MQDNISCALITAFERQYDTSWDDPKLRNERLAMRYGWTAAMEAKQCLHQIQEPAAAEQAAWHAGLDEGRAQAAQPSSVSNAETSKAAQPIAWPKDAQDVRDFFRSDFITAQFAAKDQSPCDEDRYLVSAHDFLSAVNWWADFPHMPREPQAAPAATAVPDGREEFEEWATLEGYEGFERAMRGTGHYHSIQLEQLWQSWTNSRAALAATPAAAEPLPLLVRDIARELGITCSEACLALKPLGNFSTNTAVTAEMMAKLRECFPERVPASEVAGARERMTAGRACYFMERFLKEEKLLGPNEQAALHYVIDMLEAAAAPVVLPQPVATLHCNDECYVWARASEAGQRMRFEQPIALFTEQQLRALLATATGLPAQAVEMPDFDLRTSKGGRGFVAWYFANVLQRYDYENYITNKLAADFACDLAKALSSTLAAPQAQADARDADGEAFRTAARLGLTLRFYGNCAQSGAPGTPSVYEVTTGPDSAEAMRASIDRAAIAAAKGE